MIEYVRFHYKMNVKETINKCRGCKTLFWTKEMSVQCLIISQSDNIHGESMGCSNFFYNLHETERIMPVSSQILLMNCIPKNIYEWF